jgi:transposase
MTELSANAIRVHQLLTEVLHNDTTSITFIGAYNGVDPKAVKIMHGYNKDHRPDCKQIVFGLNITADGHVPVSYQIYDGNQADVTTHVPNWEQLREMLGKEDFIYVADSKLCSYENLHTIDENGGQFITVVPRNFCEVKGFLERVRDGEEIIHYQLEWSRDEEEIRRMQRGDGIFPLVDNTFLDSVDVLRTYKEQPYLEKRFNTHKSVLEVAPVFLKTPRRIEAMMFLYFIALMLVSLIERRIRLEMQEQEIESLPMRPAGMLTKKPTWRTWTPLAEFTWRPSNNLEGRFILHSRA